MKSKLKLIFYFVVCFLFGYETQTCLINLSNTEKITSAAECSKKFLHSGAEMFACYGNEQYSLPMRVLNTFNPSEVFIDELVLQLAYLSDISIQISKYKEKQEQYR